MYIIIVIDAVVCIIVYYNVFRYPLFTHTWQAGAWGRAAFRDQAGFGVWVRQKWMALKLVQRLGEVWMMISTPATGVRLRLFEQFPE